MLPPPHSLHLLRCRPCGQMLPPPHSLQVFRCRPCGQMLPPPHSLHLLRCRPCGQSLLPPPSLHLLGCRPCGHVPAHVEVHAPEHCAVVNANAAAPAAGCLPARFDGGGDGTTGRRDCRAAVASRAAARAALAARAAAAVTAGRGLLFSGPGIARPWCATPSARFDSRGRFRR